MISQINTDVLDNLTVQFGVVVPQEIREIVTDDMVLIQFFNAFHRAWEIFRLWQLEGFIYGDLTKPKGDYMAEKVSTFFDMPYSAYAADLFVPETWEVQPEKERLGINCPIFF